MHAPRLLTLAEDAHRLGVRPTTLAKWLRSGKFPGYRTPSGSFRVAAADVDAGLHLTPARDAADGQRSEGARS